LKGGQLSAVVDKFGEAGAAAPAFGEQPANRRTFAGGRPQRRDRPLETEPAGADDRSCCVHDGLHSWSSASQTMPRDSPRAHPSKVGTSGRNLLPMLGVDSHDGSCSLTPYDLRSGDLDFRAGLGPGPFAPGAPQPTCEHRYGVVGVPPCQTPAASLPGASGRLSRVGSDARSPLAMQVRWFGGGARRRARRAPGGTTGPQLPSSTSPTIRAHNAAPGIVDGEQDRGSGVLRDGVDCEFRTPAVARDDLPVAAFRAVRARAFGCGWLGLAR
jgi:hypothetical protein